MIRDFNWCKHLSRGCGVIAAFCMALPSAHGDTIIKADNADALNLGTSWSGALVPGTNDVAQWDSSVTGVNTVNLGADAGWRGLSVLSPGGAVEISGTNTLTLGSSGIDMSSAAVDLTLSSGLSLLGNTQQSWKVAAGRTLNLHTGVFTRNTGAVLNVQGDGTVSTTNILNGATGIIGAWATIGTGASTRYATVNSGNIVAYTGTAAATAANVTSTAGTENYELAAAGAFGAGASFNTLRYTGATGTVTNPTTINGIMNVGGGTLTMANTVNVGSTNELVVNTANGNVTVTYNISNKAGDTSRLIKTGAGTLTMSIPTGGGPATSAIYSGGTHLLEGTIEVTTSRGLGDATTATVFVAEGTTLKLIGSLNLTVGDISGSGTINVMLGTGGATTTFTRSNLSGFTGILNIGDGTAGGKFQLSATTGGTSASAINVAQNGTLYVSGGITVNRALTLGGGDTGESLGQLRLENNSIYAGNITLAGDISGAGDGFFNSGFITGNIGETGGPRTLSKITSGTLTLSGANTYSGATSVLGGTLALTANLGNAGGASDVLGISSNAASNLLLANGTTLSWTGTSAASTDRLFTINGSAAGHGATISANGTTTAAILTFTNTGSLAYGAADQTRTLTLRGTNTGNNTLAMAILDNGTGLVGVTKLDSGTWVLTGNSSYKGITLLTAGTLSVSASANLGDASNTFTFDGGTLRVTGTGLADLASRTVNYGTNKVVAIEVVDSSHTFTFSQALTQGTGGFTKSGAGRVDLTNAGNNYTGVTDIADGTLRLRGAGLLSASSALRLSGANAVFDLNGANQTVKGFSSTSSSTAKIVNNSGSGTSTLTIGAGAANNSTYAGQILDNDGVSTGGKVAVIHDAAGITTQLTPTVSNTYSGGTTVKQGTLQGNDVTAYSGATTTAAINPFGSGKITLAGGTLNLRIGAGADTTAQILTLGNDMDVTAASTLNYTRQGGTTANKTLAFGHLNLGAFTLTTVGGNGYVVSFSSATLTGNGTIGGNAQGPLTLGAIGESGGSYSLTLNKTSGGAGTPFILTSASTYTGGTNLTNVTVTVQDKAAFGTGTVNLTGITATILASKALTGADKIANNFSNTQGTLVFGGSNDMEIAGTLTTSASRSTSVTNTAKTIFSGSNSNAGILGVSNGTGSIELATDMALSGTFTLIDGTGGTINSTGGKIKINSAAGNIGTSGVLTINAEIANGTASSVDFYHASGGTVVLRGANTWTGATSIIGATVDVVSLNSVAGGMASSSLGAPVSVSAGTINIGSTTINATLKYSGAGETTDRVVNLLSGNATIEHAGTGLLKFTSGFTATGGGEKTFTLSGSSTGVGEIAGAIVDNSTSNKTNVNVTGLATWVLSGNNSYTGTTTVSGRMLQVGRLGFGGRTGSGAVTIQSGGAISGTGLVNGATFTAESGSTIYAGEGTAQSDYGTLYFEAQSGPGYFDFKSGSKVILGINPGGLGDTLDFYSFSDGTLIFNGDLTVTAEAYVPDAETTFYLLNWIGMSTTTFNSRYYAASYNGYLFGNGDDNLGFDLPDIAGSGYAWDISQFAIDGTISAVAIPEPSRALLLLLGMLAFAVRRRR